MANKKISSSNSVADRMYALAREFNPCLGGYTTNVPRTTGRARPKNVQNEYAEFLKSIRKMATSHRQEQETELDTVRKKLKQVTVERDYIKNAMSQLKTSNTTERNNLNEKLRKCQERANECDVEKREVKRNLRILRLQQELSKRAKQLVDNAPPATLDAQHLKELEDLRKNLEECQTDKKACSSKNTALDSRIVISEMNLARKTKDLEEMMKKLADANAKRYEQVSTLNRQVTRDPSVQSALENAREELARKDAELNDMKEQYATHRSTMRDLQAQLNANSGVSELNQQLVRAREDLEEKTNECIRCSKEMEVTKTKIQNLSSQNDKLTEALRASQNQVGNSILNPDSNRATESLLQTTQQKLQETKNKYKNLQTIDQQLVTEKAAAQQQVEGLQKARRNVTFKVDPSIDIEKVTNEYRNTYNKVQTLFNELQNDSSLLPIPPEELGKLQELTTQQYEEGKQEIDDQSSTEGTTVHKLATLTASFKFTESLVGVLRSILKSAKEQLEQEKAAYQKELTTRNEKIVELKQEIINLANSANNLINTGEGRSSQRNTPNLQVVKTEVMENCDEVRRLLEEVRREYAELQETAYSGNKPHQQQFSKYQSNIQESEAQVMELRSAVKQYNPTDNNQGFALVKDTAGKVVKGANLVVSGELQRLSWANLLYISRNEPYADMSRTLNLEISNASSKKEKQLAVYRNYTQQLQFAMELSKNLSVQPVLRNTPLANELLKAYDFGKSELENVKGWYTEVPLLNNYPPIKKASSMTTPSTPSSTPNSSPSTPSPAPARKTESQKNQERRVDTVTTVVAGTFAATALLYCQRLFRHIDRQVTRVLPQVFAYEPSLTPMSGSLVLRGASTSPTSQLSTPPPTVTGISRVPPTPLPSRISTNSALTENSNGPSRNGTNLSDAGVFEPLEVHSDTYVNMPASSTKPLQLMMNWVCILAAQISYQISPLASILPIGTESSAISIDMHPLAGYGGMAYGQPAMTLAQPFPSGGISSSNVTVPGTIIDQFNSDGQSFSNLSPNEWAPEIRTAKRPIGKD